MFASKWLAHPDGCVCVYVQLLLYFLEHVVRVPEVLVLSSRLSNMNIMFRHNTLTMQTWFLLVPLDLLYFWGVSTKKKKVTSQSLWVPGKIKESVMLYSVNYCLAMLLYGQNNITREPTTPAFLQKKVWMNFSIGESRSTLLDSFFVLIFTLFLYPCSVLARWFLAWLRVKGRCTM